MKDYYVYEYFATMDCEIENKYNEIIKIKNGDVYYVGKGTKDRVKSGARNNECELFKKACGWAYRIVKDNLDEKDALTFESELIYKYIESGVYLTNRIKSSSLCYNAETIANIKYIDILCKNGILNMTLDNISFETETYNGLIIEVQKDNEKYKNIKPYPPDNIAYLLQEYDAEKLSEKDIKYGNILYLLNLADNGVLRISQSEIAKLYNESDSCVSYIKTGKYANTVRPLKPDNLDEIIKKYHISRLTDDEINKGSIMYIYYNFIETGILNMTMADLARETKDIYGITYGQIQDMKRRCDVDLIKPKSNIIGKLFTKYYDVYMEKGREYKEIAV